MQTTKWELYEYQRSRSVIDLGPNHLHSIFLNFFPLITADFNTSSAIRWAIQDQWSSGFRISSCLVHLDISHIIYHMRTTKGQISLRILSVWSEPILFAAMIVQYKISRLELVSGDKKAGFRLTWSQTPQNRFSGEVAQVAIPTEQFQRITDLYIPDCLFSLFETRSIFKKINFEANGALLALNKDSGRVTWSKLTLWWTYNGPKCPINWDRNGLEIRWPGTEMSLIIWNKDPLEIQHPKFENNRLGFIESVHER